MAHHPRPAEASAVVAGESSVAETVGRMLRLPHPVASEFELAIEVQAGLPVGAVDALRVHGFAADEVHRLVLNRRTLHRRRAARLAPDESNRVVRLARVYALARRAFPGAPDYAHEWLREPKRPLAGRAPLDVLDSDAGARAVEELLIQLEEGIYA